MDTERRDPRTTGEHVRRLSGEGETEGAVTLVGVVHNHPASAFRVRTVVEAADPDVLALELPPLAIPLYEQYADDERTPPPFGGEMSAAVQAASTDRVVGIDGPTPGFAGLLLRNLVGDGASRSTARSVLRSLAAVTRHALVCRLAGALAARTGLRLEVDSPVTHDAHWTDDPRDQAGDERAQIRRARTIEEVFEQSDTTRVRDVTREEQMANRLAAHRREGDVVAVVGVAHLDPVARRSTSSST